MCLIFSVLFWLCFFAFGFSRSSLVSLFFFIVLLFTFSHNEQLKWLIIRWVATRIRQTHTRPISICLDFCASAPFDYCLLSAAFVCVHSRRVHLESSNDHRIPSNIPLLLLSMVLFVTHIRTRRERAIHVKHPSTHTYSDECSANHFLYWSFMLVVCLSIFSESVSFSVCCCPFSLV